MDEENLQNLSKLMSALNPKSMTQDDFVKSFEMVLEFIKETKDLTGTELENLRTLYTDAINEIKSGNESTLNDTKGHIFTTLESKLSAFEDRINSKLNDVQEKADSLVSGQDADEEKIVEDVLARIKLPEYKETVLDTGEQIVDKINDIPLDDEDHKIGIEHIKGLRKEIDAIKSRSQIVGGGIVGRDVFKDIDISSQLNGVTKTFNIQAVWNILTVDLSSFPHALRKGVDFTWTPTSITFTSEIEASTSLATGQTCILTVVTG